MVHGAGGRKFVLYNTGPLGCLPSMLARRGGEVDRAGCLVDHNGVAGAFNAQLGSLCGELRAELANSTVVCVDMYAIKYGLVANHTAHGQKATVHCHQHRAAPVKEIHQASLLLLWSSRFQ
jgi:hypothetical protein